MLNIILSFIMASVWVSASTVLSERLGTKVGGFIITLPSTIIVAFLFMGIAEGEHFVADAAVVVPAQMGANAVFLAVFVSLSNRGLRTAVTGALATWFVLAFTVLTFPPGFMPLSLIIFSSAVIITSIWLRQRYNYKPLLGKRIEYTAVEIAFRGFFAGGIIAAAVVAASLGGPALGAVFSVFPAIFTSTMIIIYLRQGNEFTGALGRTMILGSTNVVAYAVAASILFPEYGSLNGTLLTIAASYTWSAGAYITIRKFHN